MQRTKTKAHTRTRRNRRYGRCWILPGLRCTGRFVFMASMFHDGPPRCKPCKAGTALNHAHACMGSDTIIHRFGSAPSLTLLPSTNLLSDERFVAFRQGLLVFGKQTTSWQLPSADARRDGPAAFPIELTRRSAPAAPRWARPGTLIFLWPRTQHRPPAASPCRALNSTESDLVG